MALPLGTVVAGYVIEGVLGSGGMGTVYLARHPTLPRSDALKILSVELSQDEQFRVRFIREADLAATLSHPNIVTVFNRGETDDGQLWIAMQYVEGTTASDLHATVLTPARVAAIITDVGAALDYAHSRRVLHRDIKPSNFLVSADHERVLLADFGIARAFDDTTLTATGSLVGTASYAAPEAIQGGSVDQRADVYSLGCALFRLLTGRAPYEDLRGPAMLMAHVLQPIPRPSHIVVGLPPAIDDVIAVAMAKDPAARFPTAGALAGAARAALSGQPLPQAPPGGPETRIWAAPPLSYPTTRRPGIGGGAISPAGFAGAAHPGLAGAASSSDERGGPRAPRRRKRGIIAAAIGLVTIVAAAVIAGVLLTGHRGATLAPYQPQSMTGTLGTVELHHRPVAVAALGPGDADAVLSLGVQPVAIGGTHGQTPSWLAPMVKSSPAMLPTVDPATLAETRPDLIIDTGSLDKATYNQLAAIAPTLTRPADTTQEWNWQNQLTWIATALGRTTTATTLLNNAVAEQTQIKSDNPAFSGKTITVVSLSDTTTTVATKVSPPTAYLEGLGFAYNVYFKRGPNDPPEVEVDEDSFDWGRAKMTDVMIVIRTDRAAGGGGFGGLPSKFALFNEPLVIVDDLATITALNSGGPAATTYLDTTLVNKLAHQIH